MALSESPTELNSSSKKSSVSNHTDHLSEQEASESKDGMVEEKRILDPTVGQESNLTLTHNSISSDEDSDEDKNNTKIEYDEEDDHENEEAFGELGPLTNDFNQSPKTEHTSPSLIAARTNSDKSGNKNGNNTSNPSLIPSPSPITTPKSRIPGDDSRKDGSSKGVSTTSSKGIKRIRKKVVKLDKNKESQIFSQGEDHERLNERLTQLTESHLGRVENWLDNYGSTKEMQYYDQTLSSIINNPNKVSSNPIIKSEINVKDIMKGVTSRKGFDRLVEMTHSGLEMYPYVAEQMQDNNEDDAYSEFQDYFSQFEPNSIQTFFRELKRRKQTEIIKKPTPSSNSNKESSNINKESINKKSSSTLEHFTKLVPEVYFRKDFRLEENDVFRQSIAKSFQNQEEVSSNLEDFLSSIEEGLFAQVSRAHKFQVFETMLKDTSSVMRSAGKTKISVDNLQIRVRRLKTELVNKAKRIGRLGKIKNRVIDLRKKIDLIVSVKETVPTVQMLLSAQDYGTALELLESTLECIDTKLNGVLCVKNIRDNLSNIARTMDQVFVTKFTHQVKDIIAISTTSTTKKGMELKNPDKRNGIILPEDTICPDIQTIIAERREEWREERREKMKEEKEQNMKEVALTIGGSTSMSSMSSATKITSKPCTKLPRDWALAEELLIALVKRGILKGCMSSGFRDSLLQQLKLSLKTATSNILSDAEKFLDPALSPTGIDPKNPDTQPKAVGFQARLKALSHPQFLYFWKELLRWVLSNLTYRLKNLLLLILITDRTERTERMIEDSFDNRGFDLEIIRCFEVSLSTVMQKVGTLLGYRDPTNLSHYNWSSVLEITIQELTKPLYSVIIAPVIDNSLAAIALKQKIQEEITTRQIQESQMRQIQEEITAKRNTTIQVVESYKIDSSRSYEIENQAIKNNARSGTDERDHQMIENTSDIVANTSSSVLIRHEESENPSRTPTAKSESAKLETVGQEFEQPMIIPVYKPPYTLDVTGSLRAVLYTQSKLIVEEFHHTRVSFLTMILVEDRWERCDCAIEHRAYVRYLTGQDKEIIIDPIRDAELNEISNHALGYYEPSKSRNRDQNRDQNSEKTKIVTKIQESEKKWGVHGDVKAMMREAYQEAEAEVHETTESIQLSEAEKNLERRLAAEREAEDCEREGREIPKHVKAILEGNKIGDGEASSRSTTIIKDISSGVSATTTGSSLLPKRTKSKEASSTTTDHDQTMKAILMGDGGEDLTNRYLRLEGINFLVIPSTLCMIKIITEYLEIARTLPIVAFESIQRLNQIFRLLNRDMWKLVLAGEARSNGVLKRITANNIALAAQTCNLFTALIPKLQEQLIDCLQISRFVIPSLASLRRDREVVDFDKVPAFAQNTTHAANTAVLLNTLQQQAQQKELQQNTVFNTQKGQENAAEYTANSGQNSFQQGQQGEETPNHQVQQQYYGENQHQHTTREIEQQDGDLMSKRTRMALILEFSYIIMDFQDHHFYLMKKLSDILEARYDVCSKKLFNTPHPPLEMIANSEGNMQQGSTSMQQGSTSMQQGSTSMQQGSTNCSTAIVAQQQQVVTTVVSPGGIIKLTNINLPLNEEEHGGATPSQEGTTPAEVIVTPSTPAEKAQEGGSVSSAQVISTSTQVVSTSTQEASESIRSGAAKPESPDQESGHVQEGVRNEEGQQGSLTASTNTGITEASEKITVMLKPHGPFTAFVKDITSMYRVLLKVLSGENVKIVFAKAFSIMANKLRQNLRQVAENGDQFPTMLNRIASSGGDAFSGGDNPRHNVTDDGPCYTADYPWGDRFLRDLAWLRNELKGQAMIGACIENWISDCVKAVEEELNVNTVNAVSLAATNQSVLVGSQSLASEPRLMIYLPRTLERMVHQKQLPAN